MPGYGRSGGTCGQEACHLVKERHRARPGMGGDPTVAIFGASVNHRDWKPSWTPMPVTCVFTSYWYPF